MKKLLGILAVAALTTSVFGQGTITALNLTGLVKKWTTADSSVAVNLPRSGGYVQIFGAPSGSPLNSLFTPAAGSTPSGKLFANYTSLSGFLTANPAWASTQGRSRAPS